MKIKNLFFLTMFISVFNLNSSSLTLDEATLQAYSERFHDTIVYGYIDECNGLLSEFVDNIEDLKIILSRKVLSYGLYVTTLFEVPTEITEEDDRLLFNSRLQIFKNILNFFMVYDPNYYETVEVLLSIKSDPMVHVFTEGEDDDWDGNTILHEAVIWNNIEIFEFVFEFFRDNPDSLRRLLAITGLYLNA